MEAARAFAVWDLYGYIPVKTDCKADLVTWIARVTFNILSLCKETSGDNDDALPRQLWWVQSM
jgi:hypothetical protein